MHVCMHGMMQMCDACGTHVDTRMHAGTYTHTIHICICIHARMYACGHTYACWHVWIRMCMQTRTYNPYMGMCVHGTMRVDGASHMWTCMHMCMCCFDGAGVWFPVSLSGTRLSQTADLSAWGSCVAVWVHCTRTACTTRGGALAGVVPHVLWIGGSCMHMRRARAACTCIRATRVPASMLTCTGGRRLLGGCPMGCGSCMHVHHTYTHTRMHTTYACAWHAHTCMMHTHTYMHVWTCIHVLLHAH